jgi:hypothetical protein
MKNNRRNIMRSVRLEKDKLLEIVKQNKIKHISDYEEAVIDFKEAVLKIAKDNLELAITTEISKIKKMKTVPVIPATYEESYNKALRMLELSVDSVIELEEEIFNQLVLDDWEWKRAFNFVNASYKSFKG